MPMIINSITTNKSSKKYDNIINRPINDSNEDKDKILKNDKKDFDVSSINKNLEKLKSLSLTQNDKKISEIAKENISAANSYIKDKNSADKFISLVKDQIFSNIDEASISHSIDLSKKVNKLL